MAGYDGIDNIPFVAVFFLAYNQAFLEKNEEIYEFIKSSVYLCCVQ